MKFKKKNVYLIFRKEERKEIGSMSALIFILLAVGVALGIYAWRRNLPARSVPDALKADYDQVVKPKLEKLVNKTPRSSVTVTQAPPNGVIPNGSAMRARHYY